MKKKIVAVVLCGGMGTRISELTKKIPKSLICVSQKPIIWYVISSLIKNDIKNIIFPLGYKGTYIKNYVLKKFKKENVNFKFIKTGKKTEINNRIKMIKKDLLKYENFLLVNSDTIFDFNLKNFINYHIKNNFLISLSGIKMISNWGSIVIRKNSLVKKFLVNSQINSYYLKGYKNHEAFRNTGISIINFKCLNFISKINNKNFEVSLYNKFVSKKKVGAKIFTGFWYPIETLKDFEIIKYEKQLINKIESLKKKLN